MTVELLSHNPSWAKAFESEAQKLLDALGGWAWEGGNVLPHLDAQQKSWLNEAFAIWMPEHSWRSLLK